MIYKTTFHKIIVGLVVSACWVGITSNDVNAQGNEATNPNSALATQITSVKNKNIQMMKRYSWTARTELTVKGEQKSLKTEKVHFSPEGKMVKSPIGSANDPGRKVRGLRGRVKDKKTKKMKDWLTELVVLRKKYDSISEGKMLDFLNGAKFSKGSKPGTTKISGTMGVQPKDTVVYVIDTETKSILETEIKTKSGEDNIIMKTIHRKLDSGLSYVADSKISAPGKEVVVNVQNLSYIKN